MMGASEQRWDSLGLFLANALFLPEPTGAGKLA